MEGHQNGPSSMPLDREIWTDLTSSTTLYDLIYTPRPTPWLSLGAEQGCHTIDGLEMLIQQGAASLRRWSGCSDVPVDVMREAALDSLLRQDAEPLHPQTPGLRSNRLNRGHVHPSLATVPGSTGVFTPLE